MIARLLLVAILGPLIALAATWYEPYSITRIGSSEPVTEDLMMRLREQPSEEVLVEIRSLATGEPGFSDQAAADVIAAADQLFVQQFERYGETHDVGVPFDPDNWPIENSTWGLRFCSFIVPSLLAHAFELSGNPEYLEEAVQYIEDWSAYEESLLMPIGAVFNDHAVAARAIIVTDVWRLYRDSDQFSADKAQQLLRYVQRLSALLRYDELYEYRTNHGLMQNKALMHLAIAFPGLESRENSELGLKRVAQQLQHFVNEEGVILEHSAGYHHQFVGSLAGVWRYLALKGESVPAEMIARYERARRFNDAMLRPDDTLPPIGDTDDQVREPVMRVEFDSERMSSPVFASSDVRPAPAPLLLAPAAGYAIVWHGLDTWPRSETSSQTIIAWANFISGAHKHDDELSLSIWSAGTQWIGGPGYWPYVSSRLEATGWRSSNAPHFIPDADAPARSAELLGMGAGDDQRFFDLKRTNDDGGRIRRQVVLEGGDTWVVIDSFSPANDEDSELIWKVTPGNKLRILGERRFELLNEANDRVLRVGFSNSEGTSIEVDLDGTAAWNTGMKSAEEIVSAPAIRLSSTEDKPVFGAVFELSSAEENTESDAPVLNWFGEERWEFLQSNGTEISRDGTDLVSTGATTAEVRMQVVDDHRVQANELKENALQAFDDVVNYYGKPFRHAFSQRQTISRYVLAGAVFYLLVLALIIVRFPRLWMPAAVAGTATWVAFSLYVTGMVLA